ncbi:PAS domain S-box protein [Salipaludibacillus sp. HK11]|uniref:PAS domain S-box protein n=1 Tax=Salipaludibacillus sp. HK11 TaxID=3394320 RepID=UPI0039FCC106
MDEFAKNNDLTISEKEEMYRQIVEYSFETTVIHSNHEVLYINASGAEFLRATKADFMGANIIDVFTDDYKDLIIERIRKGTEERSSGELIETTVIRADGTIAEVELYCHPVMFGQTEAIQSIMRDITPRKEAENNLKKVMNEIATPIVPVSEGIAVLPLVGDLNEARTIQMLDTIPQKIGKYHLDHLIIDVSGIYNFDDVVAEFIYKINPIIELLGISVLYTGIRPELAKKAVELQIDINSLKTMPNVKQALNQLKT